MQTKSLVWIGAGIGSTVGSLIPMLWGADMLSFSSIIFGGLGAVAGIYVFFKLGQ
jgi:hypothetical protein